MALPDATIVSATTVAGTVRDPNGKVIARGVAEFCAVNIVATPSDDSLINIALWLPTEWNGRFEGTGNGGYAGNMEQDYVPMIYAVNHGLAVAANDMGTAPSALTNADVLIGHPQKWIDWGHRATHVMTTLSKQVIATYYGRGPRYSYFNGCSTGGQQGLMSAQRYPADYDGILSGAPAHDRTHVHTNVMWMFAQAHKKPTSSIGALTADTITKNIVAACAAKSGGAPGDNFLTDPRKCDWKPSDMRCTATGQSGCLNDDQVAAATAIYAGPVDPRTGKQIYPGSVKGSENALLFGWSFTLTGVEPTFDSIFKWVFGPQWDYKKYDYHRDMAMMDSFLAPFLNATNPDLRKFRNRNGKIILYHGFADPLVSPGSSIDYYESVVKFENDGKFEPASTQKYFRLFMAPGMNHCGDGAGPNRFGQLYGSSDPPVDDAKHHALQALMRWVEKDKAPDTIIASKLSGGDGSSVVMQRPLCPYPTFARYKGEGDPAAASSFICKR